MMLLLLMMINNMAAARKLYLAFGVMMTTNEPLKAKGV
jgi:hypothetical protein